MQIIFKKLQDLKTKELLKYTKAVFELADKEKQLQISLIEFYI